MVVADSPQAWQVDAADFPVGSPVEEMLRFALRYAILAPSSHNSQPWRFWLDGSVVELYSDRTRRLPIVDPADRELVMSCGAALKNLQVALSYFGEDVAVTPFPEPQRTDLLARVELVGRPVVAAPHIKDLFVAITRRHTTRRTFDPAPVSEQVFLELRRAAFDDRAWLFEVPLQKQPTLAHLIADGDTTQMSDPHFRRELVHWMRPNYPMSTDGMPGYALGYSELQSVVGPLVIRTFDVGYSQAAKDEDLVNGSPLLAVLATPGDDVASWLAAGQAMQHVLLTAAAGGLQASFLNQPVEVPALRAKLASELGLTGYPQLLMRFGYGPTGSATPRRPVRDVLLRSRPA
jgi:nitroreductase family protein